MTKPNDKPRRARLAPRSGLALQSVASLTITALVFASAIWASIDNFAPDGGGSLYIVLYETGAAPES